MRNSKGQFVKGCKKTDAWRKAMEKRKGENHHMWKEQKEEIVKCACGCGKKMNKYDKRKRVRKYKENHFQTTGNGRTGKKHTKKARKKISSTKRGTDINEWDGFANTWKERARSSGEWCEWRSTIFERDNFTCKDCGANGVYLEPHHIIPIRSNKDKLYDLENGITLCRPCHQKTFGKELQLAPRYKKMLD